MILSNQLVYLAAPTLSVRGTHVLSEYPGRLRVCLGLFVWVVLNGMLHVSAQDIHFKYFSQEEGLPNSEIRQIFQNQDGFIWLATSAGLSRYDGVTFKNYFSVPLDSTTLSSNEIWSLHQDPSGKIWIGSNGGGLNQYDPISNTFKRYRYLPEDAREYTPLTVYDIVQDDNGMLWLDVASGLLRFDPVHETFFSVDLDGDGAETFVTTLHKDRNGLIWMDNGTGLYSINPYDNNAIQKYPHESIWASGGDILQKWIYHIEDDEDGNLWLGTPNGLYRFNPETGSRDRYLYDEEEPEWLTQNSIIEIAEDPQGILWLATPHGAWRFDPSTETGHFFRLSDQTATFAALKNFVTSLFIDQSGLVWLGTRNGLYRARTDQENYEAIRIDSGSADIPGNGEIITLFKDRTGTVWFGTQNGLSWLDRTKETAFSGQDLGKQVHPALPGVYVRSICQSPDGSLWVGSMQGLFHLDPERKQVIKTYEEFPGQPDNYFSTYVSSVFCSQNGDIWLAIRNVGMYRLDHSTESFFLDPVISSSLAHSIAEIILKDQNGALWIATNSGLYRFDNTVTRFRQDFTRPDGLSSNSITSLSEDDSGSIWVGTANGLNRYDPNTQTFEHVFEKDRFGSSRINGIEQDDIGNLYVLSERGISIIDLITRSTIHDYEIDARYNFFNAGFVRVDDGRFLISSFNQVVTVQPSRPPNTAYVPPVVITEVLLANKPLLTDSTVTYKNSIDLSYKDDIVSFDIAALDYWAPTQNAYSYLLEGFSDEWIDIGNQTRITFTNLNPGTYTLRVRGAGYGGVWNEKEASLTVRIAPPVWVTWWFRIFAGGVAGLGIWGLIRVRERRLKAYQQELEERVTERTLELETAWKAAEAGNETKTRFLANVSHELRTPLTLILPPLSDLSNERFGKLPDAALTHIELIKKNASRLYYMINDFLDLSKIEEGHKQSNKKRNDITALLRYVHSSFSILAIQKNIDFRLTGDEERIQFSYDSDQLERVFVNLISNAFKYTPDGRAIGIRIGRPDDRHVEVSIIDQGMGISSEHHERIFDRFYRVDQACLEPGTGIGLPYARELVHLHDGTITVTSKVGTGSTFTVTLPLLEEEETPLRNKEAAAFPSYIDTEVGQLMTTEAAADQGPIDSNKSTVLIVDDNEDVRQYLKAQLGNEYNIIQASNGSEALEKTLSDLPDVIICDVMMPVMDGIAFTNALKHNPEINYLPVILLTANTASRLPGLRQGADDYLTKPFELEELKLRINNLIEGRKKLLDKYTRPEFKLELAPLSVDSHERNFMNRVQHAIEMHLGDNEFDVNQLAEHLGLSRSGMYRQIQPLMNISPGELIREYRLQRAAQLLEAKAGTISEIAYSVGFKNVSHFSTSFSKRYGRSPAAYQAHHLEKD